MAREMKNSGIEWIGEIPREWEIRPAKYAFIEIKDKNTDGRITNALKFYSGSIVRKMNFDADSDDYVADTITNYTIVVPNTIIINGLNLNYDLKSLRVGLVTETGIITSAYLALKPDINKILPKYATYLFKGYETKMAFHNMGAGIRKTLGYKEIKTQPVLLPPLPEQQKIADFLDSECAKIDDVISKTKATVEEYKKLKQSVITKAVTKGIRPNREMKDSGIEWIGEIPREWDVVNLKSKFKFGKGLPITKEDLIANGIPVISYGQIHSKSNSTAKIIPELIRYVSQKYLETNKDSIVNPNDFIFADTSEDLVGCGNNVYNNNYNDILFAGYHTIILKSISKNSSRYLGYLFMTDSWRSQIRCRVSGIKLFSITQKILKSTTIILPSIPEQQEIADYLDKKCAEIDTLITKKEQLTAELESYKKSLIYEYVTGKKEVK